MGIHRSRSRPFVRLAVVAVAAALAVLGVIAPAWAGARPYCGITWGSLAKQGAALGPVTGATVSNVRAGQHACYDRLVIDVRGATAVDSWRVEYVPQVTADASGRPVPLRGGAFLQITAGASDHTAAGVPTYTPANRSELVNVTGYRTFRQVAAAGSFEGLTSVGLGVRARLPFRVFTLTGSPGATDGARVVVDVAHHW